MEEIWQKRISPKKGYDRVTRILILVMFVSIKEVHPRERNLKGGNK